MKNFKGLLIGIIFLSVLSILALPQVCPADQIYGFHPSINDATIDQTLTEMNQLGVEGLRMGGASWAEIEPVEGTYTFDKLDNRIQALMNHNLKFVILTVRAASPWGSSYIDLLNPGRTYPPKDMNQYSTFIKTLVDHYKGATYKNKIKIVWQIENEPNAPGYWGGTKQDYLDLLTAAYNAAHAADPGAVVIPAGLSCGFSQLCTTQYQVDQKMARIKDWFDSILDTKAYDAIDIHDYYPPQSDPNWQYWNTTFEQYLDNCKTWMQAKNVNVPLWMSELGISSENLIYGTTVIPFTPGQQVADLEADYAAAKARGIESAIWLRLTDQDEGNAFSYMGLKDVNLQQKPAWLTYQKIANAPVLNPIAAQSVNEGAVLNFTVTATDPNGDILIYSATLSDGSSLPAGASINSASGFFTWTPSFNQAGSYVIAFTVSDGQFSDSKTTTITVNKVNSAPVLAVIPDKTVNEYTALSFVLTAYDPDGDSLTFSATPLPSGATLDSKGNFNWPNPTPGGIYPITFTVSDGALTDSKSMTIKVLDITPPVISNGSASAASTSITVQWMTNEPATSQVDYGTTKNYGSVKYDASLTTAHTVTLTNLQKKTTYHFKVSSKDASGNLAVGKDYAIRTLR